MEFIVVSPQPWENNWLSKHYVARELARRGRVQGSLALPVAGLLSQERLEMVVSRVEELERLAAGLGCRLPSPLAALSFLALPVIPELRLTDRGLLDVVKGRLLS